MPSTYQHWLERGLFVSLVLGITWLGEEFPVDGAANLWYGESVLGVPLHYPLYAGLILLLAPFATGRLKVGGESRFVTIECGAGCSCQVLR